MFNECLFHLCDCTCSNVMCVCSIICGSNWKVFFFIILFVFGSVFHHSLFLGFVPSLFINVSSLFLCWKTRIRVFHELFATWLWVAKLKIAFLAFLVSRQRLLRESHDCLARRAYLRSIHENSQLPTKISKSAILWVFHEFLVQNSSYVSLMTLSSQNPLSQSFYIKTQLISIALHSINISKVIFNTFNWFWSLDYIFGGFIFIVEIFSNGGWKI